ncbi:hypothetical protein PC129_g16294 [Phytophthora cactorum]|uniref:Uncharacterized protein n=1 Tax=Phytophthora cactorum TaxID=29920 RepID=A0A8T0YMB6_9STRA|nr:hypothetical protein PC112_g20924 [Phytophthora cactorum]KAG2849713.1 hypothetical protein PC113_g17307 [Phytophthora cactorum]KAG2896981.1 hypothetical protein PC117_g22867 [Phytophthora cactorum]KAG3212748.1 hypothetical protein PC129_g16294 [Phytophthora cactorum]
MLQLLNLVTHYGVEDVKDVMLHPPRYKIHGVLTLLLLLAFCAAPRLNECNDKPCISSMPAPEHC